MSKILLETEKQIVYRGFDDDTIDAMHTELSLGKRLFCIYASRDELITGQFPKSLLLGLYECIDEIPDEYIMDKHLKLEHSIIEWTPISGINKGLVNSFLNSTK